MFDGAGVATGASGILCDTTSRHFHIHDCRFQDFWGRAILSDTASSGIIDNCFAENSLLNAYHPGTGAAIITYTGVVEIQGNDCIVRDCELAAGDTGAASGTGFACALVVTGGTAGNNWFEDIQCEGADIGMYVNPTANAATKITSVRADINFLHGFVVAGGVGIFTGCHSYRNGRLAINTYNGFPSYRG